MTSAAIDNARVNALIADIKLANNGYLLLAYMGEGRKAFAQECAQKGLVDIRNGLVFLPGFQPEFFKATYPVKSFSLNHDGPDYEGAILSRQAEAGLYD
jgi:hypothetical protein